MAAREEDNIRREADNFRVGDRTLVGVGNSGEVAAGTRRREMAAAAAYLKVMTCFCYSGQMRRACRAVVDSRRYRLPDSTPPGAEVADIHTGDTHPMVAAVAATVGKAEGEICPLLPCLVASG